VGEAGQGEEERRSTVRAVIFDLGGVVLGSPLHAISKFERRHGIERGFVNRVVADSGPDSAWHRLERGEIALGQRFFDLFDAECAAAGVELSSAEMFDAIHAEAAPRPSMIEAIGRLREAGLRVAALTNNWSSEPGQEGLGGEARREGLDRHFDVFLESSVLGMRKPDPRIYLHACRELGTEPPETAFLDDIGANLKSARELGMATIKVTEPEAALRELESIVGVTLLAASNEATHTPKETER
jgi:epoxide hydrolase-like predicted phosphatase